MHKNGLNRVFGSTLTCDFFFLLVFTTSFTDDLGYERVLKFFCTRSERQYIVIISYINLLTSLNVQFIQFICMCLVAGKWCIVTLNSFARRFNWACNQRAK